MAPGWSPDGSSTSSPTQPPHASTFRLFRVVPGAYSAGLMAGVLVTFSSSVAGRAIVEKMPKSETKLVHVRSRRMGLIDALFWNSE